MYIKDMIRSREQKAMRQLQKENAALKKEIQKLTQGRDADRKIGKMSRETMQMYQELLLEVRKLRKDYNDKIQELVLLKAEYKKRFDALLQEITDNS